MDYYKYCRICCRLDLNPIPLFGHDAQRNEIVRKINKHLPIKVEENDLYPKKICITCYKLVQNWDRVTTVCRETNEQFTKHIKCCVEPHIDKNKQGLNQLQEDAQKRLSTPCLILIIKEVLKNDYCQILNINDKNSDLVYVCQICSEKPASTSLDCLCDHLIMWHRGELSNKASVGEFIQENITFEEALINDVGGDELENPNSAEIPNFLCPFCESAFSSPTRLICHLNKHIEVSLDDGVLCCDNLFADKKSFVLHLQDKHVNRLTDGVPMCKTCGAMERTHEALATHVHEKHPEVEDQKKKIEPNLKCQKYIPAVCPECNKSFSNKYNMLHHLKSHTQELPSSKFMCTRCNKTYKSRGSLTQHQRVFHEGLLRFLCSMCGEAFPSRLARDTHARLHTGSKPFTCHYCNKSYRAQNTLKRHMDMHLNIRKYECHLCPKKFRKKTHLDYHSKTHDKKKCGDAGASCSLQVFARHLVMSHAKFHILCDECETYILRRDYEIHVRRHVIEKLRAVEERAKSFMKKKILAHIVRSCTIKKSRIPRWCRGIKYSLKDNPGDSEEEDTDSCPEVEDIATPPSANDGSPKIDIQFTMQLIYGEKICDIMGNNNNSLVTLDTTDSQETRVLYKDTGRDTSDRPQSSTSNAEMTRQVTLPSAQNRISGPGGSTQWPCTRCQGRTHPSSTMVFLGMQNPLPPRSNVPAPSTQIQFNAPAPSTQSQLNALAPTTQSSNAPAPSTQSSYAPAPSTQSSNAPAPATQDSLSAHVPSAQSPVSAFVRSAQIPVSAPVPSAQSPVSVSIPSAQSPVSAPVPSAQSPVSASVPSTQSPVSASVPSAQSQVIAPVPSAQNSVSMPVSPAQSPLNESASSAQNSVNVLEAADASVFDASASAEPRRAGVPFTRARIRRSARIAAFRNV